MVKVWLPKGILAAANADIEITESSQKKASGHRPKQNRPSAGRWAVMSPSGSWGHYACGVSLAIPASASGLRLAIRGRRRTGALLGHELVELLLVLGVTQAIEEIAEFGLLFLETPQSFRAVFVERPVAA
jgi:hypothetical protein